MPTPVLVFEQRCPEGGIVAAWTLMVTRSQVNAFVSLAAYFPPGVPLRCPRSISSGACCINQRMAHQRIAAVARRMVVEHSAPRHPRIANFAPAIPAVSLAS